MFDTLEELRAIVRLRKIILERLDAQIKQLKGQISDSCDHPDDFVVEFQWEHDDGYGKQTKRTARRCQICNKVRRWSLWAEEDS